MSNELEQSVEAMNPGFHDPVKKKGPVLIGGDPGSNLAILASLAHMATIYPRGGYEPRGSSYGLNRGDCRKPKNLNNDPDRAKGMQEFRFDRQGQLDPNNPDPEYRVYAGTLKAARKKLALLIRNSG